jgi:hypothetical protein
LAVSFLRQVGARYPESLDLGAVMCPSGILAILDPGYMDMWSGSAEPTPVFSASDDAATRASIESAADYFIGGKDGVAVARMADIQAFNFIYDMPQEGAEKIMQRIAGLSSVHGLDAHLEREARRIPHRERAQRVADLGGGDFVMQGPWVTVVGGLHRDEMRVHAIAHDYGGHVGVRWTEVVVEARRLQVESSGLIGYVGVDYGMALLADADALSLWQHSGHFPYLLAQVEKNPNETATVELAAARLLGLSTSWGDGAFPVWLDRGANGEVAAVRVVFGDEKRRQMMEQVWERAARA